MTLSVEQLHALLEEVQERLKNPLPEMQPFQVELKDPRPSERSTKIGWIRKLSAEIDSEVYDQLKRLPDNYVLKGFLWLEEMPAEQQQTKTTKKTEGEYGQFWKDMFLEMVIGSADFKMTFPGLENGLENWSKTVAGHFGLVNESLNTVGPKQLIAFIEKTWANTEKQGIVERLTRKINEVAGLSNSQFPPGQYFSPAMLGARKVEKKQPEPESDEAFIKEHKMF